MRKVLVIALAGAVLPAFGANPLESQSAALPGKLPSTIDLSQSEFTDRAPQAHAKRIASGSGVLRTFLPSTCYFIRQLASPQKPVDKPRFVPLADVQIAPQANNPDCLTDSIVRKSEPFR
ncbi:MAG: hypothetical protein ABI645_17050 [Pseudomonadota bacterium]